MFFGERTAKKKIKNKTYIQRYKKHCVQLYIIITTPRAEVISHIMTYTVGR